MKLHESLSQYTVRRLLLIKANYYANLFFCGEPLNILFKLHSMVIWIINILFCIFP